jgi:apolipoprotein N-acyltransferase
MWVAIGAVAFYLAYASANAGAFVLVYLFALLQLAQSTKWRAAYYCGLVTGLIIAASRLTFFWNIFGPGAIALWLVFAFWIGLFAALARLCLRRVRAPWGWLLVPFLWTGLEYFRSELYYLKFSWLNPGYAFTAAPKEVSLGQIGVYGVGFMLMAVACITALLWRRSRMQAAAILLLGAAGIYLNGLRSPANAPTTKATVRISGIQMEFPTEPEVLTRLNQLITAGPDFDVAVLSEYTFDCPPPAAMRQWCRKNQKYLIAGGKNPAPGSNFDNTAYVVGPEGNIQFQQVKAVPIQFFKDGRPAANQELWDSPWGKIGICICYDLSYSRVTDRLARLGAQALIVPTMDVADWGRRQHELHARIAPTRAAEYGIPIFRLASSGISQWVDRTGTVCASAPIEGEGAVLRANLELRGPARLPLDRWLAPFSTVVTIGLIVGFLTAGGWESLRRR